MKARESEWNRKEQRVFPHYGNRFHESSRLLDLACLIAPGHTQRDVCEVTCNETRIFKYDHSSLCYDDNLVVRATTFPFSFPSSTSKNEITLPQINLSEFVVRKYVFFTFLFIAYTNITEINYYYFTYCISRNHFRIHDFIILVISLLSLNVLYIFILTIIIFRK